MDLANFLIQLLNSVQYGLLLFMLAAGLTLIFGIMGVVNLAHGSFYMLGAYAAYTLTGLTGSLFWAIPLGTLLALVFGYLLEWAFFSFLYRRDHLQQVLLTYGLILVFEELRSIAVGDDVHGVAAPAALSASLPLGSTMTYPVYNLFISAACLVIASGLFILLRRTRLGMMIRAGASNREMVQPLGIDIKRLFRIVFALGVGLAAFAGMISAPASSVYPGMGNQVLIICFVVVVIGGIGSVTGSLVAALLIGFTDTFGKVFLTENAGMLDYLPVAVVLLWRPEGLFRSTTG